MAKPIVIADGATISAGEVERVEAALKDLAEKKIDAPRDITLTATLHVHHEFPKLLYKGKESRSVADKDQEAAAAAAGFGPYDHEAFTAKEA